MPLTPRAAHPILAHFAPDEIIYSLRENDQSTYILLDGLVCSIARYFSSHAVFWQAHRANQNTRDEKRFIIQLEMF